MGASEIDVSEMVPEERSQRVGASDKSKKEGGNMALTIDSKIGELLADPKAKAILEKHMPGISTNPQMAMAKGMSLKVVAPMSGGQITPDKIKAIEADLKKL
ncbi:MAG: hypothetical protein NTU41_13295 [Chloroflexi bacterium]|nr:hypothetical protein [Chloroflexota bacterium]